MIHAHVVEVQQVGAHHDRPLVPNQDRPTGGCHVHVDEVDHVPRAMVETLQMLARLMLHERRTWPELQEAHA